jgi:hypothetical protein
MKTDVGNVMDLFHERINYDFMIQTALVFRGVYVLRIFREY